ncbi:MAG: serine protease MucD, partial [Gammaproteobacteria bacterium]
MKKITRSILFLLIITSPQLIAAGLPENISELVEDSAPAVVNITSKKEITSRQMGGYGGIPDE